MVGLIKALAAEIRDAVKNYRLHGDRDPPDGVTIYQQYVPIERFEQADGRYHPFILIALREVEDGEQSEAGIGLTFGVYGEDDETWQDLLNLMETVRIRLLQVRLMWKKYRLIDTMETEIGDLQPAPFFYGEMRLKYWVYQPAEEIRREEHGIQTRDIRDGAGN